MAVGEGVGVVVDGDNDGRTWQEGRPVAKIAERYISRNAGFKGVD